MNGLGQSLCLILSFLILTLTRERVRIDTTELKADIRRYGLICAACAAYTVFGFVSTNIAVYYRRVTMGSVFLLIANLMLLAWLFFFFRSRFGNKLTSNAASKNRLGPILVLIFISVATASFVFRALQAKWGNLSLINPGLELSIIRKLLWWALTFGVYVAVSEELFFRVALFSLLEKAGIKAQKAQICISALLFGLLHLLELAFPQGAARQFVIQKSLNATVIGVVLGHVYLARGKNFLHPVLLHWLINMAGNYGIQIMTIILLNI